ncbi:hypothetical protein LCGC14_0405360 [marine sediment metagenome]|uniref:Peptidase M15A C-terminal domain-containing protein n=1 Tax=marine sediment metagenome TaxID=412755 RepID=A0A0F9TDI7_9ZZZZ
MKQDIKVSDNFWLWEFFDKETYEKCSKNVLIGILDPKIIALSQYIRNRYDLAVTINNWKSGGFYSFSGFRPPTYKIKESDFKDIVCKPCLEEIKSIPDPVGATLSQHKFGRACDYKIAGMTPEEFRIDIKESFRSFKVRGLSTIELGTDTWTHCDVRATGKHTLLEVPFF